MTIRNRSSLSRHQKAFTLVEMLVVMVIVGLLITVIMQGFGYSMGLLGLTSALVLPKFPAIYDRFKSRAEQDAFFQSLGVLPLKAYTQQQTITLNQATAPQLLELPSGWKLLIEKPIVYKANGVCLGGTLSYTVKGISVPIQLTPPYCEAMRL